MSKFDLIGFDADDTLWQNERNYNNAQTRFAQLLSRYHPESWVRERLYQTESRNMQHYGYGIKAFALSMIETAVELTEGRVSGQDISAVLEVAREMINAPVELLPGVAETIARLAASRRLVLITKGDLLDQERKVEKSGLGDYFTEVEVVSHKSAEVYSRLLKRHQTTPERFLMVGNSLRSDVLPVLALGGSGVHIPHDMTWQHEVAETPPPGTPGFYLLNSFDELPALLDRLDSSG